MYINKLSLIYFIFVLITISTIFPIIFYFLGYPLLFDVYIRVYFFTIFIYIWYRFINLAYHDFRRELFEANLFTPFTVIAPCFNEEPALLERSIESVQKANGSKKIIIVDDGSTNDIWETIIKLKEKYDNVEIHRFPRNEGKRKALYWAFNKVDTELLVTIDSDTLVDKNAFVYLIAPLADKRIGATTGDIRLLNEKRNLLTRIIAAMYLSGINNYKKSQSALGNVTCCSGCLSAYRTKVIKEISDKFLNQKFLGHRAAHSEDRHLTNLILEKKFKVIYVERAVCYTESPHTLKSFLKQQQRWKRGFVRETIYLLSYSYKNSRSLLFEALVGNALPYFLSLGLQVLIITFIFIKPTHVLFYILPSWIIFMTIRELPMLVDHPLRSFWFYFYIPLYEILLFWQNIWAVFTVNNTNWLTRNTPPNQKLSSVQSSKTPLNKSYQ